MRGKFIVHFLMIKKMTMQWTKTRLELLPSQWALALADKGIDKLPPNVIVRGKIPVLGILLMKCATC